MATWPIVLYLVNRMIAVMLRLGTCHGRKLQARAHIVRIIRKTQTLQASTENFEEI